MRKLFLVLYTVMLLFAIAVLMGCETVSPLCTENYCIEGSVYPRSDLPDGAEYADLPIDDAQLLSMFAGMDAPTTLMPVTTPEADDTVTISHIVDETLEGRNSYEGQVIKVTGVVDKDASTFNNRNALTLHTGNEGVVFFITSDGIPELIGRYKSGESYTFEVFVLSITAPNTNTPYHGIFSSLVTEKTSLSIDTIVADVASGGREHITKVVSLNATVNNEADIFIDTSDTISLVTNHRNVIFFLSNWTAPPNIMGAYQKGVSYDFEIYIRIIEKRGNNYYIQSYIVIE